MRDSPYPFWLTLPVITLLWCVLAMPVQAERILVINSYNLDYSWSKAVYAGFRKVLEPIHELRHVGMDTKNLPPAQHQASADQAFDIFMAWKPGLVILMDDNALRYLGQDISEQGVPVVFSGINGNPRDYFNYRPAKVTGSLERFPFEFALLEMHKILKCAQDHVLVVMDMTPTSDKIMREGFKGKSRRSLQGLEGQIYRARYFDDLMTRVRQSSKDGYGCIMLTSIGGFLDGNNRAMNAIDVTRAVRQESLLPVFAGSVDLVGRDLAIGGFALQPELHGEEVAEMALELMAGQVMPFARFPRSGRYVFSRSGMQAWGGEVPSDLSGTVTWVP